MTNVAEKYMPSLGGLIVMGYNGGSVQKHGNRFYVQLYWNKQTEKFWSVLIQGQWCPIKSEENGYKLLYAIREEIDRDREGFDPRSFRPGNPLCIGEYYKTWLNQIKAGKKCKTDYKGAILNHIIPFFTADKDIRKFKKAELTRFQESLPLTDKGRYNVMGALKSMVRWAYSNEEIKHVPPFPKMSMGDLPEIEYLTIDQQEQVLAHIPAPDAPIFRFAMEYGIRVGEARAIKRDAIKNDRIYIKRAFSDNELKEKTKTGDIRNPELTPYAKEIISGQKHISEYLFIRSDGKPYTNKNLNKIWHEAETKAGIKIKLYNAIRHSLGCQLLDEGQDLSTVQELLGHKNAAMTRRYAKRTSKKLGQILTLRRCGRVAVENKESSNDNH